MHSFFGADSVHELELRLREFTLAGSGEGAMAQMQRDSGYIQQRVRPCALAGTRYDHIAALGCVLLLGAIFGLEVITPVDVVGALALLPLAAGAWVLSGRMAGMVIAAGAMLFALALVVEWGNRVTLLLVGIPVLVTAGTVRLYASSLCVAPLGDKQKSRGVAWPALHADQFDDGYAEAALTHRELEVARLAARAYTAAEIGHQLHIGERTVESHIASTYLKLGIRSRSELIRMASRLN
jgi:DNA-binding CsgD family transcriptional regulator